MPSLSKFSDSKYEHDDEDGATTPQFLDAHRRPSSSSVSSSASSTSSAPTPTDTAGAAATSSTAPAAAGPLFLAEPIETSQQFLNWYSQIEDEMEQGLADVYRSHIGTLRTYLSSCDDLLALIADARQNLADQSNHFHFVSSKTSSLQGACEALLAEQQRLAEVAELVGDRLRKFDVLEPAVRLFSSTGDLVCLDADFVPMLARLDDCLSFVQEKHTYKDAELYLMKFRQCMTRGLSLIKVYFISALRSLQSDIKEKLSTRREAEQIRPLLSEIEVRCEGHSEYLGLLGECFAAYFATRRTLLSPYVSQAVAEISAESNILTTAKKGAAYIMSLCTDECSLFYQFFELGEEELALYLDSLSAALYDHLRPMILREIRIDILAELCRSLQVHVDAVDSLALGVTSPITVHSATSVDEDSVSGTSPHHPTARDAPVKRVVERVLQDAQERLAFRSQQYIKEEIEGFRPRDRELEVLARTSK
ncbi:Golgi transport complex subunit 3, partial [Cladochytrium tenue]